MRTGDRNWLGRRDLKAIEFWGGGVPDRKQGCQEHSGPLWPIFLLSLLLKGYPAKKLHSMAPADTHSWICP